MPLAHTDQPTYACAFLYRPLVPLPIFLIYTPQGINLRLSDEDLIYLSPFLLSASLSREYSHFTFSGPFPFDSAF